MLMLMLMQYKVNLTTILSNLWSLWLNFF